MWTKLGIELDQTGYLGPRDRFRPPVWGDENVVSIQDQFRALEDPSAEFWRLTAAGIPASPYASSPLQNVDPMVSSFISLDPVELQDEPAWHSQVSSRMGSFDQGRLSAYALGSYPSETDFAGLPPGLASASASTASLTASTSEASQYGGGGGGGGAGGDGRRHYVISSNPWASDGMVDTGTYKFEPPVDVDPFDQNGVSFYMDEDQRPYSIPMHHGIAPVRMSHG